MCFALATLLESSFSRDFRQGDKRANHSLLMAKKSDSSKPAIIGKKARFPSYIEPMLATLVDQPPVGAGWQYEVKWDGYRAVAYMRKGKVQLLSRNQKSFDEQFYPVHDALSRWKINAVIDGELVVLDENGQTDFQALQGWRSEADGALVYYVFDLLWSEGYSLLHLPLAERQAALRKIIPKGDLIRVSDARTAKGNDLFKLAKKLGLEGIMAKRSDSVYTPGKRSDQWLKIKVNRRQEVVIGGYTVNEGSSKPFSSLLVGVYEKDKLQYTGKIGTGFSVALQKELLAQFKPLIRKTPPFAVTPDINKPSRFRPNPPVAKAVWLKPALLCEVSYRALTADGVMRHPSFEGLRDDKKITEVKLEKPISVKKIANAKIATKVLRAPGKRNRATLVNPHESTQVRIVEGHELTFSNLNKIYWPKEKIAKRELINYYYQAAPFILPYLKDRPQSLNRFPNGITGESFYQKDVTGKAPDWIRLFAYHTSDGKNKNFMVVEGEASLLYMANLGAIEMNPWNCRIQSPDNPDWCLIDLDPDKKNTFEQVIETALAVKSVLDELDVPGYIKTSGATGLHIYIPLAAKYSYDQCQLFGRFIAHRTHALLPEFTSVERLTSKRKNKIYIDFLQNRPGATLAAPYSVRPKPGATVSMPLEWSEVQPGLQIADFTIKNAVQRMRDKGDIFKPVLGRGVNLKKVIRKLDK